MPSINISPSVASKKRGTRLISVDLPLPVEPMKAIVSPCLTEKLMSRNTCSAASGYLNPTFLNTTSPRRPGRPSVLVPSLMVGCVSSTSLMRRADTLARGYITNIMTSIKNDITTCMA